MWLDLQQLSQKLLKFNQELVMTKYFTSITTGSNAKRQRQLTYIEALQSLDYLEVTRGRFQDEPNVCPKCNFRYTIPNEKKTDVAIAVNMVYDAYENKYDTAILISADADLVPAIELLSNKYEHKRIIVAIPPGKRAGELASVAHGFTYIGKSHLSQSQLPPSVRRSDGFRLVKPAEWE